MLWVDTTWDIFQAHLLASDSRPDQIEYFSNSEGKSSFARRRLTFNAQAQLEHQFPNVAFWPENASLFDPSHRSGFLSLVFMLLNTSNFSSRFIAEAIWAMQTGKEAKYWPHIKNLVQDFGGTIAGTARVIQQRYLYGRRLPRLCDEPVRNLPVAVSL